MKKEETLQSIAHHLMLYTSFTNNIGLLNGKMGIAIFFYHYSKYTGNKLYNSFAGELIDEIYEGIHINTPLTFDNGLAGIAWGLEYLIRNDFVNADPDEVLEDIDKQLFERDVRRIKDISLETGLKGISYYVLSRWENRKYQNSNTPKEYIKDLIKALKENNSSDQEGNSLIKHLSLLDQGYTTHGSNNNLLFNLSKEIIYQPNSVFEIIRPLGIINKGFAGIGLKIIQEYYEKQNLYL